MALTELRIQQLTDSIGLGIDDFYHELDERKKEMWAHVEDGAGSADEDLSRQTYEELVKFQARAERLVKYFGKITQDLATAPFVPGRAVQMTLDGPRVLRPEEDAHEQ